MGIRWWLFLAAGVIIVMLASNVAIRLSDLTQRKMDLDQLTLKVLQSTAECDKKLSKQQQEWGRMMAAATKNCTEKLQHHLNADRQKQTAPPPSPSPSPIQTPSLIRQEEAPSKTNPVESIFEDEKLDIVYLWANLSQAPFSKEWENFRTKNKPDLQSLLGLEQLTGARAQLLRYSLRSVYTHLKSIRNIFIVHPDGSEPWWLKADATSSPSLKLVPYSQIFTNKDHLPNFNFLAWEAHIHRIPRLGKYYLLMRDSMVVNQPLFPDYFWTYADGIKFYTTEREVDAPRNFGDIPKTHDLLYDATVATQHTIGRLLNAQRTYTRASVPLLFDTTIVNRLVAKYAWPLEKTSASKIRDRWNFVVPFGYMQYVMNHMVPHHGDHSQWIPQMVTTELDFDGDGFLDVFEVQHMLSRISDREISFDTASAFMEKSQVLLEAARKKIGDAIQGSGRGGVLSPSSLILLPGIAQKLKLSSDKYRYTTAVASLHSIRVNDGASLRADLATLGSQTANFIHFVDMMAFDHPKRDKVMEDIYSELEKLFPTAAPWERK